MLPVQTINFKSRYSDLLKTCNSHELTDVKTWIFKPGMAFQSGMKWWGDLGKRDTIHEGIDLLWYLDHKGREKMVQNRLSVPAPEKGQIQKVIRDYLGYSIFIRHPVSYGAYTLFSLLGHVTPPPTLNEGDTVKQGDVIAGLTLFPEKKSGMKSHIHFSLAWIHKTYDTDSLNWESLTNDRNITLIDPEPYLQVHHEID